MTNKQSLIIARHLVENEPKKLVEKLAIAFESNDTLANFLTEDCEVPNYTEEEIFNRVNEKLSRYGSKTLVSIDYKSVKYYLTASFEWSMNVNVVIKVYYKSNEDLKNTSWDHKYTPDNEYNIEGMYYTTEYVSL